MSLVLVRVDDRLVHGQVMVGWRTHLEATRILVASDRLAANEAACRVLRLSAPAEVNLSLDTVEGMVRRLRAGEFGDERSILLFENLSDVISALDLGMTFEHLNLGGLRHQNSCVAFSPAVSLAPPDLQALREIMDRGVPIDIQMMPREKPIPLDQATLSRRLGSGPS